MTLGGSEVRFRYEERVISLIRRPDARNYLVHCGLPADNPLFLPVSAYPLAAEGREFIVVGGDGASDAGLYCVDIDTGEVAITSPGLDAGIGYVNASPYVFDRCISEFTRGCPYGSRTSEREDLELISEDLGRVLLGIDDTIFEEDPGFWHTLLNDVAIGDYLEP